MATVKDRLWDSQVGGEPGGREFPSPGQMATQGWLLGWSEKWSGLGLILEAGLDCELREGAESLGTAGVVMH